MNKKCKVKDCTKDVYTKGYCNRHYRQIKARGYTWGNPLRTFYDPNEFILKGDICTIKLYDLQGWKVANCIIDKKYYKYAKKYKWGLISGYCRNKKIGLIHRKIIKPVEGMEVDHIDGDTLNCRKYNLRVCSHAENSCNRKIPKNSSTGVKGVTFIKHINKYQARIRIGKKEIVIGYFKKLINAAKAYNKAALEYHGEFSRLNDLDEVRKL